MRISRLKIDGHHTGAGIKNLLGGSRARALLGAVGFSVIIPRHRDGLTLLFNAAAAFLLFT